MAEIYNVRHGCVDVRRCLRSKSEPISRKSAKRSSAHSNVLIHNLKNGRYKLEQDASLCKCRSWLPTTMSPVPGISTDIIDRLRLEKVLCLAEIAT